MDARATSPPNEKRRIEGDTDFWATPDFEFRKPVAVDLDVLVNLELWLGHLLSSL